MAILPRTGPLPRAVVRVPGSKSLTNRALIIAAMADGPSVLTGALDCDDTRVMVERFGGSASPLTHEPAAAEIRVQGCGGTIPAGGRAGGGQFGHEPAVPDGDAGHRAGDVPARWHPADAATAGRRPLEALDGWASTPLGPRDRLPAGHHPGVGLRRRLAFVTGTSPASFSADS